MANYDEGKNFVKMDWAMPFQRTGKFPIDRSSIFSTKADADLYAAGGADSRGLGGTSYVGQIITVYENSKVEVYKIAENRTLEKVGNGLGTITADNYDAAKALAKSDNVGQVIYCLNDQKFKEGETEKIEYAKGPYIVTAEGTLLKLASSTASGDVTKDVQDLQTKVGVIEGVVGKTAEEGLQKAVTDNTANIATNTSDLATIKGVGEGSIKKTVADAVGVLTKDASEGMNTFKEVEDKIGTMDDTISKKVGSVTGENAIKVTGTTAPKVSLLIDTNPGNVTLSNTDSGLKAEVTLTTGAADGSVKIGGSEAVVKGWGDVAKSTKVAEDITAAKTAVLGGADVQDTVKSVKEALAKEASRADAAEKANATAIKELTEGAVATNTKDIADINTKLGADGTIGKQVVDNKAAIELLNKQDGTVGSVKKTVDDAVNALATGQVATNTQAIADVKKTADTALQTVSVDDASIEGNGKNSAIKIKAGGVTNDMLAGSIADEKIAGVSASKVSILDEANHTTETSVEGAIAELYTKEKATADALGTKGDAKEVDSAFGRIAKNADEISTIKDSIKGGTHFKGVLTELPEATSYHNGDIIAISGGSSENEGKEYILSATVSPEGVESEQKWIELGDTSKEGERLTALEAKVGKDTVSNQIDTKINALDLANTYAPKQATADSISALNTKLEGVDKVTTSIETAKTELVGDTGDTKDSATIAGAKKYADDLNTAMDTRVKKAEASLQTLEGEGEGSVKKVAADLADEKQARTSEISRVEGLANTAQSTADAKVAGVTASGNTVTIDNQDAKNPVVNFNIGTQTSNIVKLEDSANGLVAKLSIVTGTENGTIKVNETDIPVAGLKSAAFAETSEFDAAGAANTVKTELLGKAPSGTTLETLNTAITSEVSTREALSKAVGTKEDTVEAGKTSLWAEVNENEAVTSKSLGDLDTRLKTKVDAVEGSRLMTNAEGTKLEGIATGAQVNKIETISVNGVVATIGQSKDATVAIKAGDIEVGTPLGTKEASAKVSEVLSEIYTKLGEVEGAKVGSVASADNDLTISVSGTKDVKLAVGLSTDEGNILKKGLDNKLFAALYYDGDDADPNPDPAPTV